METKQPTSQQEITTPVEETTSERIERHSHPETMSFEELVDVDNL